jgi:hypothetical protein
MFPADYRLFQITSGQCSCNLIIQTRHRSVDDQRERLRARYEREDWSQARIARAITDWETNHERLVKKRGELGNELCSLLRVLAAGRGGVRVFIHFYSGSFDTEELQSGRPVRIAAASLINPSIIGEDRLVEVV